MNWKKNNINVAIQVLPEADGKIKYELVDAAIETIRQSGLPFQVCPFETVVECSFEELPELMEKIHESCKAAGTERMIMNLKVEVDFNNKVTINDKMNKYENSISKCDSSPFKSKKSRFFTFEGRSLKLLHYGQKEL